MKAKLIAAVIGIGLLASPARADIMIMGLGLDSCGTWTHKRQTESWGADMSWVLGYITGMNATLIVLAQSNGGNIQGMAIDLAGTDAWGIAGWLDNYCRANPIKNLYQAADAFTGERLQNNKSLRKELSKMNSRDRNAEGSR